MCTISQESYEIGTIYKIISHCDMVLLRVTFVPVKDYVALVFMKRFLYSGLVHVRLKGYEKLRGVGVETCLKHCTHCVQTVCC